MAIKKNIVCHVVHISQRPYRAVVENSQLAIDFVNSISITTMQAYAFRCTNSFIIMYVHSYLKFSGF